ncbi:Oidioi.mRNA.OKI2018_I69.chr2.g6738.t1.cds [Oikopleura dioica]|uniref:Oidioi.mRNA.OKI2018_I69.chr2.g6738.t1.cds n=1 Tax=Oikopleura dioica TaxID=34765 RepID=A0ABN7T4E8_OIKDI|nr:Oidioi.mRNA.OKI2018_I69.chr2.g6738.t1.cds [Oikopleura dioica]
MKVLYFLSTGIRKVNFRFTNEDLQVEGFGWNLKYSDKVLKLKNSDGNVRIIAVCDHHYMPSIHYNFRKCTESNAYCEETATDENGYQVLRLNSNFDKSKYKYGARHYYTFNVEIL